MAFANRPTASDGRSIFTRRISRSPLTETPQRNGRRNLKQAPPEQTNAESFYYLKQMNSKTPIVIVMTDGETIEGRIEWYDKSCLKINREGAPNLLIQKHCIKYLFKKDEMGAP